VHLYSLYSDLNSDWSEYYASQPEVLAYWERLVDKHSQSNDPAALVSLTFTRGG